VASVQEVHSRTTQGTRTQGPTETARETARPAACYSPVIAAQADGARFNAPVAYPEEAFW